MRRARSPTAFQAIPVAQRELDVIETYLGALLDDALGEPE
jgi:hypothetical protein